MGASFHDGKRKNQMDLHPGKRRLPYQHVHKDQPDLIFVLQGRATMFIDGVGEFPLEPQMVVQVPKNTRHTIRNIEEDILIYNVFAPAMKYMKPGDRL
jgi:mannose-6-phosphate isomerase-like protein (cupin superfamily)